MTDSDIKFFLELKHRVHNTPFYILLLIGLLAANGVYGFIPFIDSGFSFGVCIPLFLNFIAATFRTGFAAQCHDLIEKLINRDAELIQRISEYEARRNTPGR
jgi:hypothetical protein